MTAGKVRGSSEASLGGWAGTSPPAAQDHEAARTFPNLDGGSPRFPFPSAVLSEPPAPRSGEVSRPTRRGARGFTFVELIVALAVLGTAFTVLLSAHMSATRLSAHARRLFEATTLAREIMTKTEIEGLPVFDKDSGEFGPDFPAYRWERQVAPVLGIPFLADLREVTVRVLWAEGQQTRSAEVVFYRVKR